MRLPSLPCNLIKLLGLAACLQANSVLASIYPTQPVAKTNFTSGKFALITWRDDWRVPLLADMAHMWIDLYSNNTVSYWPER